VQIFAPGIAAFEAAKYYEVIFERENAAPTTRSPATTSIATPSRLCKADDDRRGGTVE
jgi:hypothetical protein